MGIQLKDQLLEVLKWVGVVFVAGFIGYFGRYLSMLIIERIHRRRHEPSIAELGTKEVMTSEGNKSDGKKLKLEKKGLKLEKKKAKKAGDETAGEAKQQ